MFWNMPYPYGIADIKRKNMIDLDECGIELSTAERDIGKTYIGDCCNQSGLYSKTDKLNLLLAILGDEELTLRWKDIWTGEGTTGQKIVDFVHWIIEDLKNLGLPDRRFCFLMDNLTSHHNHQMADLLMGAGSDLVFRAPYYSIGLSIE